MEAIDYVKLFKLDQENYDFKREEFISELGKDFLDYCQNTTIGINPKHGYIYYYRAISKLKVGEPFTQKLWNAFFATQVVPLRKKLFPEVQKLIEEQKGIIQNDPRPGNPYRSKQDKKPSNPKKVKYGKGNPRPSWQ